MTEIIRVAGKEVLLFPAQGRAPLVVLNMDRQEGEDICREIQERTDVGFSLAAIGGVDWNAELSPWPAEAVFRGEDPFAGGADGYLARLTGDILPRIEGALPEPPSARVLAGYSLAGLFALYSLFRTDRFDRVACASGSFWYPGFKDFIREHAPVRWPDSAYFSLGDREARTRNPLMRTVEENTVALADWCRERGVDTRFELNPGNHFTDIPGRMAKGIAWTLERFRAGGGD